MGATQCKYGDESQSGGAVVSAAKKTKKKRKRGKKKDSKTKGGEGAKGEKDKGKGDSTKPDPSEPEEVAPKKHKKDKSKDEAVLEQLKDETKKKEEPPSKDVQFSIEEHKEEGEIAGGEVPGAGAPGAVAINVKESKRKPTLPDRPDMYKFNLNADSLRQPSYHPPAPDTCSAKCISYIPKCFAAHYILVVIATVYASVYFIYALYATDDYKNNDVIFFTLKGAEHRGSWKLICIITLCSFSCLTWCLNLYTGLMDTSHSWIAAVFCCYPLKWCCAPSHTIRRMPSDLSDLEWQFWGCYVVLSIGAVWYSGDAVYAIFVTGNHDHKVNTATEWVWWIVQLIWWSCGGIVICTYVAAHPLRCLLCPVDETSGMTGQNAIELTAKLE